MSIARWNHTDPFPNSEVKRCCGDDSLGVALRKNSSMPGLYIEQIRASSVMEGAFVFLSLLVFSSEGGIMIEPQKVSDINSVSRLRIGNKICGYLQNIKRKELGRQVKY